MKETKRNEEKQTGEKRKTDREREKREKKRRFFPAFQLSELDGPRIKVDSRIASYAWVLKSWSFVKLHELENFPTLNIFSLKVM